MQCLIESDFSGVFSTRGIQLQEHYQRICHRMRFSKPPLLQFSRGDQARRGNSSKYQRQSELRRLLGIELHKTVEAFKHRADTENRDSHIHEYDRYRYACDRERAH